MDKSITNDIRKRRSKITPAPWARSPATHRGGFTFGENDIQAQGDGKAFHVVAWNGFDSADGTKAQKRANAIFIANAPMDVSNLLAEVERLELEIAYQQERGKNNVLAYSLEIKNKDGALRVARDAIQLLMDSEEHNSIGTRSMANTAQEQITKVLNGEKA